MDVIYIVGQVIGFIAMALIIISFQIKKPVMMVLMQCAAQVCFTVHFFMIGSVSGAVQNLISVVRGVFLASGVKALRSRPMMFVFAGIYAVSPVVMGLVIPGKSIEILDFLPAIAMMVNTFCIWDLNSKRHRLSQLFVASPLWIAYDAISRSYSGIITELFNAVSSLIFLIRIRAFSRKRGSERKE